MTIGVPRETKAGESRVALTPDVCRRCVAVGATVVIQRSAGLRAGFTDVEYITAGAKIVPSAARVWHTADLIIKVKEPLPSEFDLIRPRQLLFTYLHLAANPELAAVLIRKRVLSIAYETVEASDRSLPLLKPMSQIAGKLAVQIGAYLLQTQNGGSGVLLGGVPGTRPGHVVVVGAGNSGAQAIRVAVGMGARVTALDHDGHKLDALDREYCGRVATLHANVTNIQSTVADADLLIGAVLVPAARAPTVISSGMVQTMRPGSALVDIAIDQGGCVASMRATSHIAPFYKKFGVTHYAVPNMPAMVGRTSTVALCQATEPFVLSIARVGIDAALLDPRLAKGVNTKDGVITNGSVRQALEGARPQKYQRGVFASVE